VPLNARSVSASTVKLAIAATVLARHSGIPRPGSWCLLLREMIIPSDDARPTPSRLWHDDRARIALPTSCGRSGSSDTLMYGGWRRDVCRSAPRGRGPGGREDTTAWDTARSGARFGSPPAGQRSARRGLTPATRYLLWLTAHVRTIEAERVRRDRKVECCTRVDLGCAARHRPVFWEGVSSRAYDLGASGSRSPSDRLAGKVARSLTAAPQGR
jgi:hypothetical protein